MSKLTAKDLKEIKRLVTKDKSDIVRNALMFFSAASGLSKGDLKPVVTQFVRDLALLADEGSFELADCFIDAWGGHVRDEGNPRQFIRAAAAMGAEQLKHVEAAHW